MQLACILHMVPGWKKATSVRVFMCVDNKVKDAASLHRQWEQMLQMLRIDATIHVVLWDHITSPLNQSITDLTQTSIYNANDYYQSGDHSAQDGPEIGEEQQESFVLEDGFLHNVNTMIQEHSSNTATVFLYLPPPPAIKAETPQYLEHLDLLTANLPPTLLVHGISPVTSTTLW